MDQFAIRCHPSVPVSADKLEEWLEQQVNELRADAPHGTVRLSRLTQGVPSGDLGIGWLLEFELSETERATAEEHLAEVLRDMRLLGFQPTLLAPDTSQSAVTRDACGTFVSRSSRNISAMGPSRMSPRRRGGWRPQG